MCSDMTVDQTSNIGVYTIHPCVYSVHLTMPSTALHHVFWSHDAGCWVSIETACLVQPFLGVLVTRLCPHAFQISNQCVPLMMYCMHELQLFTCLLGAPFKALLSSFPTYMHWNKNTNENDFSVLVSDEVNLQSIM